MTGRPSRALAMSRAACVDLDRVDAAEPPEHVEIVAGAAAHFENARALRRLDPPFDQGRKDVAPRDVPPVDLVDPRHLVVDFALHQANTHWRLREKVTIGVTNTIGMTDHQTGPPSCLTSSQMKN